MQSDSSDLFDLLKSNSINEIESILSANPSDAETVNDQGVSLLLMAVYYGNKEAVTVIKKFRKLLTPWEAVCTGEIDKLNQLLERDPSLVNAASSDGFSLLGYACFFNQDTIAHLLIERGANVNAASQNSMKVAPLHSAAASSNYNLCKLLLENGADVNAVQQGGYTALHAAAQNGKTALAKLFLEDGADKNLLTEKEESAVMLAISKSHSETAQFIENFKR